MKMKTLYIPALLFLLSGGFLFAELPVSITVDTSAGYSFTGQAFTAENTTSAGKEFDLLSGFTVELGNWVGYDEGITDEVFIETGLSPLDWLTVSLHPAVTFGEGVGFNLNTGLALEWELESIGLTIGDENSVCFFLIDGGFEYTNTFVLSQSVGLNDSSSLIFGAENEFIVESDGTLSDGISISAGMEISFFTWALSYDLGIVPDIDHGIGLNAVFEW